MDTLQRFPLVWCPSCEKTQKMIFDLLPAGGKNDHDAGISCAITVSRSLRHCTLPEHRRPERVRSGPRGHERWRAKHWTV
jgi:hypothetical protein